MDPLPVEDALVLRFADLCLPYEYTVSRRAFQTYSGWVNAMLSGRKGVRVVEFPLALSYPVPEDLDAVVQHYAWQDAHPFPPFAAAPAASVEKVFARSAPKANLESPDDGVAGFFASEAEDAPDPYFIYARTNAMTQAEADALPASDFHFLMQEVTAACFVRPCHQSCI